MRSHYVEPLLCCIFSASIIALGSADVRAEAGPSRTSADVAPIKAPLKAFAFDLNQIQLLDSDFKRAQDLDRRDLLATNMDVLYYPFRREAKLPILVFNFKREGNIERAIAGHKIGTIVRE